MRYIKILLLITGILFSVFACGGSGSLVGGDDGADKSWGTAELIESDDLGDAEAPQVAFDTNGNAIAVWQQWDGATGMYHIWANQYTAGSGWGTAGMIETDNSGDASMPQVAVDTNGDAIAVWQKWDGVVNHIETNRYTAGSGWGTAEMIEADDSGDAGMPQIAIDTNGNAIAVWQKWDGIVNHIWSVRYTAGSGWGATEEIETDDSGDAGMPQIAIDASGNAIAIWQKWDGTVNNIWANRYTAGSGWGTAELLETDNSGDAYKPQIVFDNAGNAIAVWQQSDGTFDNIRANRYTAGSGWGMAGLIETDNTGNASLPQVAMDENGNAIAVWRQWDDAMGMNHVWANRYTAGSGWGTAGLIETDNTGNASLPQIAMDENGNAVAVWRQWDDILGMNHVWANHYAAGSGWGTAGLIDTNLGDASAPQVSIDKNGDAIAVWRQSDGVRNNIWANRYD